MELETARALGCDSIEELEALLDGDNDAFLGLDNLEGIVAPDTVPVWANEDTGDDDEALGYELL